MRILGIETSCDETAVSIIEASGTFERDFSYKILGNALLSQEVHKDYGGVFPNLARREHSRNLVPLLMEALRQAELLPEGHPNPSEETIAEIKSILGREEELFVFLEQFLRAYGTPRIDCIAVTHGPGLEPALWVGVNFAKALARAWSIPIVGVNHMEGHVVMAMMHGGKRAPFEFPLLSLLVSGGHTMLVLSSEFGRYQLIGTTRDDAVGEAFDKTARMLGLDYPGGPEIGRYARTARDLHIKPSFSLPRPMLHSHDYDFSFAGLKTAVKNLIESHGEVTEELRKEVSLEFENAVTDVIITKTVDALDEHGARSLVMSGGVSANEHLRKRLAEELKKRDGSVTLLTPAPELATDNAVMIALAGYFYALNKEFTEPAELRANGSLRLA